MQKKLLEIGLMIFKPKEPINPVSETQRRGFHQEPRTANHTNNGRAAGLKKFYGKIDQKRKEDDKPHQHRQIDEILYDHPEDSQHGPSF